MSRYEGKTIRPTTEADSNPPQYDDLIGKLLEGPCWIADVLPEQVL